jgi:hypothetical protein
MHPLFDEIMRWRVGDPVRRDVQIRWQQTLRDHVQPQLDRVAALERENADLREQNLDLQTQPKKGKAA